MLPPVWMGADAAGVVGVVRATLPVRLGAAPGTGAGRARGPLLPLGTGVRPAKERPWAHRVFLHSSEQLRQHAPLRASGDQVLPGVGKRREQPLPL